MTAKPQIKAIIFDLDGTLIDSIVDIAGAMNAALKSFGYPEHPVEEYKSFIGDGQTELVKRALPEDKRTPEIIDKVAKKYWDNYDLQWYLNTNIFPGVLYLIQLAVARKMKLAILSNKPHYFTKKMIRHFFRGAMIRHTKNPFGVYSGEEADKPKKPDPTVALELAKRLIVKPQYVALVGDSPVDIKTAKNAGMIAIGAAWGYGNKKDLQDAGADLIFDSPTEMTTYFDSQPLCP
ncbi:MAG: HAD family hydrolase [Candidatus Cloacimonas sp.]|jgi:phosphoglycolate phosphatase|nr:HAD family hydrolase [Candidatus Cloacimonas sp.]HNX02546.1 HAD family hydrolase [Candidatus Cloacimonas sp.]HPS59931.1 HAD family hydrolase [Candidatus Cloacimonas sp.]